MWDYGTLVAYIIPNKYHARIVKKVEGRGEEDTFPTAYKTNTKKMSFTCREAPIFLSSRLNI